jgi:hypothetical protein
MELGEVRATQNAFGEFGGDAALWHGDVAALPSGDRGSSVIGIS